MVNPATAVRDQRSSAGAEAEAPRVKRAPRTAQEKQLLERESGEFGGGGAHRYARLAEAKPKASSSSLPPPARRLVPRARKARIVLSQRSSPTPSSQDKGKARAMDTQPTAVLAARQIMIAGVTETASAPAVASTSAAVVAAVSSSARPVQPTVSLAGSSSSVMLLHADSAAASSPASALDPLSSALRLSATPSSVWSEPAPTSSWSSMAAITTAASVSAATTAPVPSLQPATFAPVLATSPTASPSSSPVSLKHNTPLQLLIIIGSVVVFATLVTGFAWLCRSLGVCGTSRKRKREKSDWSPSAPSNATFPPVDHHATALKWVNSFSSAPSRDRKADDSFTGPTDEKPLPHLTNPHGTPSRPPPAAQQQDGHGWQLYDAPVPSSRRGSVREEAVALPSSGGGGNYGAGIASALGGGRIPDAADMESAIGNNAWVPPARRPSFIERILMQRAGSAGMPSALSGDDGNARNSDPEAARPASDDQYTHMPGRASRAILGRRGSLPQPRNTLLSVFMRSNAPNNARSKHHRRRHSAALLTDSDFEGTIGGRDGELPMAKRLGKKDGRFVCDDSTEADKSSPDTFTAALRPFSSSFTGPTLCMTPAGICATPHTPGLAGVGSAWAQKADVVAVPRPAARNEQRTATTLAELKRQQAELDLRMVMSGNDSYGRGKLEAKVGRWMETSRDADMIERSSPLSAAAESLSNARHQLQRSNVEAARTQQLRRQATMTTLSDSSISSLDAYALGGAPLAPLTARAMELQMPDHSPAPSILPRFAATTTLSSWLVEDDKHGLHEEDSAEIFSILDKYQASPLPAKEAALLAVPVLSMRTGRSSLPPSYESPGSSPSRNSSAYDENQFSRSPDEQASASAYTSECSTPVSLYEAPPAKSAGRAQRAVDANEAWNVGEEAVEEERRQVDRRQKLVRKEQRQAARALAREQARAQALELTPESEQAEAHDRRHVVLDMAAQGVDLPADASMQRSDSMASSSIYSSLSGASEYAAPVFAGQALANAGPPPRRIVAPGHRSRLVSKAVLPYVDGDAHVAAAALKVHSVPALNIQPRRHSAISPPDSPWTSGSEATRWQGGRRAPGSFIVQHARSASHSSSNGTAVAPSQATLRTVSATARTRAVRERDIPPTGYTAVHKRAPVTAARRSRPSTPALAA